MLHFGASLFLSLFSTYPSLVTSRRRKHPNTCLVKIKQPNSANYTYKEFGCYNACCDGQANGCCPWYTIPIIFVCTMTLLCLMWLIAETFWKWRQEYKRGPQTSIAASDDSSLETMLMISTNHQLPSTSGGGFQNQNYGSNSRQPVVKTNSLPTYEEATAM